MNFSIPVALTAGRLIEIIVFIAIAALVLMWVMIMVADFVQELVGFLQETWRVIVPIVAFFGFLWLLIAIGVLEGW